jgi:6-phosphofructokinase 2
MSAGRLDPDQGAEAFSGRHYTMPVAIVTLTLNPALDVSTATPHVAPAHKLRCAAPRFDPGGGGINVARVIQRLGGQALAVYPAGGLAGQRLTALLEAEGATAHATPIEGDTRKSFTVTDQSDAAEYRFVLPGPSLSDAEQDRVVGAALAAATGGGFLAVSGSLPPGVEPRRLQDLARRAKTRGVRLVIDSSGPALAAAVEAGVHLVKPNLRELSDLVGHALPTTDDRLKACRDLIDGGGVAAVALSMGPEGALLATRDSAWTSPGLPIEPVSTVGAGDSFLAALLWVLARDGDLAEGLRFAVAAGSAALLTPGTDLCRREDVLRLAEQVAVSAI